ncbi:hypothetical protein MTX78_17690 [Hymenobacter tibetensis]|uniref:DUF3575 domain-containing protein n=1 Tax=Hymenobacter tibetensis TaxID=497967 RepID=A0ABY4CV74_9BACT|nr:hypothetical protein [Hymenobacter tibetensis]UOG73942.1 hypothetical protein MTX78_17690 [Hymenobacter tibetensis]
MHFAAIITKASCATGVALVVHLSAVAQGSDSTAATAAARPAGSGTLVKLGTGLTPGLEYNSYYRRLFAPLVLGAEHHLTPAVSVFANAFGGFNTGRRLRFADGSRSSIIGEYGFDAGGRYYYNQEKRRQKSRATGPFVGNYVGLHATAVYSNTTYYAHRYSSLTAIWGMQRRIGKYGWFDAYAGLGIGYEPYFNSSDHYDPVPEVGIKFSLGGRVR